MENNEDNDEPARDSVRKPARDPTSNSHSEDAQQETLLEKAEEKEQKENEEATEAEEEGQGKSEGPTEAEKEWIKENPHECEIEGCVGGKFGRPYRSKKMGGMHLHKWNTHGIKAGDKEKKKAEPEGDKEKKKAKEGEVDMVNDAIKRKEAAELKGKLTQTINRIIKLGTKQKEVLEPENSILKEWKRRCLQKECAEEEIAFMQDELSSIISTIDELEKESKEEKQKKVTKGTKKEEDDDDFSGSDEIKERIKSSRLLDQLDELDERKEQRETRRQRREQREEEDHQARLQVLKGSGGLIGGGNSNNPMGLVYERIVTFKHDEDGNVIVGENGQPIPESMREIPINPNALVQSRGRGGDGGESSTIKLLETAVKLVKGDEDKKEDIVKELREERKDFMDRIAAQNLESRDKDIYNNFNKLAGAIEGINKKIEEDPMDAYITMQDRLKDHNITVDGSTSPEVRKVDLEIEREKTRRSTDLMMMNKTFGVLDTALTKLSDGPIAKTLAKKIDQSDVIPEEEDMPGDEEIEQEMEEEVAPPRQPADEVPKLPPKRSRRGKNARKKAGPN